jgi:hypothetical protein
VAADPPDKWLQILQISGRRSLTCESLFLSEFTSDVNNTNYITSLGISSMYENLICFLSIRYCSFGKSDGVYKGLTKWAGWILDSGQPDFLALT